MAEAMTAKELTDLLTLKNVKQAELAERLGVNKQTVHRWCKGTRKIDQFKAAAIKAALKK
jgi:transcriptional regulator with XRE-family HTH domain